MTLNPFKAIENYYAKSNNNFGSAAEPHLVNISRGSQAAKNNGSNFTNKFKDQSSPEAGAQAVQSSSHKEIREWLNDRNSNGITL
jgi:hypothetical protein